MMSFLSESFGIRQKLIVFLVVLIAVSSTVFAEQEVSPMPPGKKQVVHQFALNWIQVGTRQYQRSYYKAARQSFLRAKEYKEFLAANEWKQLNRLLERTHQAMLERNGILKHVQTANQLLKQGLFINAKAQLQKIRSSRFLTEEEQIKIILSISQLDSKLAEQQKEITELYSRSVELYNAGRLQIALTGFIEVAENGLFEATAGYRPEEYIKRIDNILGTTVKPPLPTEEESMGEMGLSDENSIDLLDIWAEPENQSEQDTIGKLNDSEVIAIAEPITEEHTPSSAESNSKTAGKSIRQSYAMAVVKDAVAKAEIYVEEGKFYRAKEAIKTARQAVNENRHYLGEEIFKEYNLKLRLLSNQIYDGRTMWLGSWGSKVEQKMYSSKN